WIGATARRRARGARRRLVVAGCGRLERDRQWLGCVSRCVAFARSFTALGGRRTLSAGARRGATGIAQIPGGGRPAARTRAPGLPARQGGVHGGRAGSEIAGIVGRVITRL